VSPLYPTSIRVEPEVLDDWDALAKLLTARLGTPLSRVGALRVAIREQLKQERALARRTGKRGLRP